jgi:hypothetical protein
MWAMGKGSRKHEILFRILGRSPIPLWCDQTVIRVHLMDTMKQTYTVNTFSFRRFRFFSTGGFPGCRPNVKAGAILNTQTGGKYGLVSCVGVSWE